MAHATTTSECLNDLGQLTQCCNHRLFLGPHWGVLAASNLMIAAPGLLVCFFTAYNAALRVVVAAMMAVALAALWKTATMDPGVLPKRRPPPPPPLGGSPAGDRSTTEQLELRRRDGTVKRITVERKWCYSCNLLRPPRCAHCPFCDVCVLRRDHHCAFTSTDIGERNYRFFFLFINATSALALVVLVGSSFGLSRRWARHRDATAAFWAAAGETYYLELVLIVYAAVIALMVGGLTLYHWTLVCRNFTTHEETRAARLHDAPQESPFDVGVVGNIYEFLFAPMPQSHVVFGSAGGMRHRGFEGERSAGSPEAVEMQAVLPVTRRGDATQFPFPTPSIVPCTPSTDAGDDQLHILEERAGAGDTCRLVAAAETGAVAGVGGAFGFSHQDATKLNANDMSDCDY